MPVRLVMVAATAVLQAVSCPWAYASATTAPSSERLSAGSAFVEWLQSVFQLPSLLPDELRRMGVDVRLRESVEGTGDRTKRRTYAVVNGIPTTREMMVTYDVRWGFVDKAGARLSLWFLGPTAPCITEEALTTRLGDTFERSSVRIIRDGFGGHTPRAKDERITYYTTAGNLIVSFLFEYACASKLDIVDHRPAGWRPPDDARPLGAFAITAQGRVNVDERVAYWQEQLKSAALVRSPKARLLAWLDSKGVRYRADADGLSCVIETLQGDGVVCAAWHIMMSAKFDAAGRVKSYEVLRASQCR